MQAQKKSIKLNILLPRQLLGKLLKGVNLYVDKNKILQIMKHVISNAIKYTPNYMGNITVSVFITNKYNIEENISAGMDDNYLEISITDNGCGMTQVD